MKILISLCAFTILVFANVNNSNSNGFNLSSITANKVNVNVGNNTHLKGSLIASGNFSF